MTYLSADEFARVIEASKPYYEIEQETVLELVGKDEAGMIITKVINAQTGDIIGEIGVMEETEDATE